MLQQGPWGKHFGKTAPALSCLSFFSLERKEKKKGERERSPQCGGTWSWGRLGFRKAGNVAASSSFLSQGLSAFAQPQKYLTLQSRHFCDPFFFLSLYLLVPTRRLHETSPDLTQPATKVSEHLETETWFLLAFPRRQELWWGKTLAALVRHPLAASWRSRDGAVYVRAWHFQVKFSHALHTSKSVPRANISVFYKITGWLLNTAVMQTVRTLHSVPWKKGLPSSNSLREQNHLLPVALKLARIGERRKKPFPSRCMSSCLPCLWQLNEGFDHSCLAWESAPASEMQLCLKRHSTGGQDEPVHLVRDILLLMLVRWAERQPASVCTWAAPAMQLLGRLGSDNP